MLSSTHLTRAKGPFYLFCAFTLAGSSVLPARYLSADLGVFTITAVSLCFALFFLAAVCGRRLLPSIKRMTLFDIALLFLQAFFGMFLFRAFLITGLTLTSAGEAGVLTGATPAITTILAGLLLKEQLSWKKILGILSTICGISLLQGVLALGSSFSGDHFMGNLLVLCAAFCESSFNILSRFFTRTQQRLANSAVARRTFKSGVTLEPDVQSFLVSFFAIMLCIVPASQEDPFSCLTAAELPQWLALLWYGIFVTALAFMFWYAGIRRSSAVTAAAFSGMMPLTALLLSVVVLGERTGPHQWAGSGLIIAGVLLISITEASVSETKTQLPAKDESD